MNLVVDVGNSVIKTGFFKEASLEEKHVFYQAEEFFTFLKTVRVENLMVSSVTGNSPAILETVSAIGQKFSISPELPLPITNRYSTPGTLGVDRIAAACGAWLLFPHEPSLVIDIGTCINYEFVNRDGEYLGGAISPGVKMRFLAMHQQTAKLPLAMPVETSPLYGDDTVSCLQSGVMNGVLEEIKGIIARYVAEYPGMRVILCGGDAHFFENHLNPSIFVAPELVLKGLNSILLHNVNS